MAQAAEHANHAAQGEWRQPTCAWTPVYSFAGCCATDAFAVSSGACTFATTTYDTCCTDLTPAPPPPPPPPAAWSCTSPPAHLFTSSGFYAGYAIAAENNLDAGALDIDVSCSTARYYSGTPAVADCETNGGEYILSGCQPIICEHACNALRNLVLLQHFYHRL